MTIVHPPSRGRTRLNKWILEANVPHGPVVRPAGTVLTNLAHTLPNGLK
jgi:hypothetical protein